MRPFLELMIGGVGQRLWARILEDDDPRQTPEHAAAVVQQHQGPSHAS